MSWICRICASFQKQKLEENLNDELRFYERSAGPLNRSPLAGRAFRAFWGNLLSPSHVAGLGGLLWIVFA